MSILERYAFTPPTLGLVAFVWSSMGAEMTFEIRKSFIHLFPPAFGTDKVEIDAVASFNFYDRSCLFITGRKGTRWAFLGVR